MDLHRHTGAAVAAALLILSPLWTLAAKKERSRGEHLLGRPAPLFTGVSVNSGSQSLSSYKGKVILLDFWATWCGPCKKEMPTIKRISEKFDDKEFALIGISLDKEKRVLKDYMDENGIDWPIVFDGKGWKNRVASQYGVHSIPFTVLIDRKGIVRKVGLRGEALEDAIAKMIASTSD
jgi:thiol-disulfide isomerase/thioredoxin